MPSSQKADAAIRITKANASAIAKRLQKTLTTDYAWKGSYQQAFVATAKLLGWRTQEAMAANYLAPAGDVTTDITMSLSDAAVLYRSAVKSTIGDLLSKTADEMIRRASDDLEVGQTLDDFETVDWLRYQVRDKFVGDLARKLNDNQIMIEAIFFEFTEEVVWTERDPNTHAAQILFDKALDLVETRLEDGVATQETMPLEEGVLRKRALVEMQAKSSMPTTPQLAGEILQLMNGTPADKFAEIIRTKMFQDIMLDVAQKAPEGVVRSMTGAAAMFLHLLCAELFPEASIWEAAYAGTDFDQKPYMRVFWFFHGLFDRSDDLRRQVTTELPEGNEAGDPVADAAMAITKHALRAVGAPYVKSRENAAGIQKLFAKKDPANPYHDVDFQETLEYYPDIDVILAEALGKLRGVAKDDQVGAVVVAAEAMLRTFCAKLHPKLGLEEAAKTGSDFDKKPYMRVFWILHDLMEENAELRQLATARYATKGTAGHPSVVAAMAIIRHVLTQIGADFND